MSALQHSDKKDDKEEDKTLLSSGIDIANINLDNLYNYSYGLTIGAGIGDSIGSYLEFSNGNSLCEVIDYALTMPGGGTWGSRIKCGQITDDTELAISLCRGLIQIIDHQQNIINNDKKNKNKNKKHHIFDSHYVAVEYSKWYESNPFDIGGCTSTTISESPYIDRMKRAAFDYNEMMKAQFKTSGNLANGSLMRCMSLIVYGYKLNYKQLYDIMREESSLTHANILIYIANTVYAISAQYLLQTHDESAEEKKENNNRNKRNINAFLLGEKWLNDLNRHKNNKYSKEVFDWLMDCKQNDISKLQPATEFIGFIKIAFQRAFYHLWNGTEFETAIKCTISEGGDTDTNCCIVGGLLGAYWGFNKIPNKFVEKIIHCVPAKPNRDNLFQTKLYKNGKYIEKLINNAPNTVEIKIYEMAESGDGDNDESD